MQPSPTAHANSPWLLTALLGGLFMNGLVPAPMVPAMPAIARELGGGYDGQLIAQMIMAGPGFMLVVGGLLAGPLVAYFDKKGLDKKGFGKRKVMQGAAFCFALFGLAGLIAPTLPTLFVARMLVGTASGCCASVAVSLIGDYYDSQGRLRVLGWGAALGGVAVSGGLILSGILVDHFGWRAPFVLYAVSLLMVYAVQRGVQRGVQTEVSTAPNSASTPVHAHQPVNLSVIRATLAPTWYLLVLLIVSAIGLFTMSTQGPFLLQAINITSATVQGLILSASTMASVVSSALAFVVRKRLQPVQMLMLSLGGLGVWLTACGLVRGVAMITAMDVLVGLFAGLAVPTFKAMILDKTPEAGRTLIAGLMTGAVFVGQGLAPFVVTPLSRVYGVQGAFIAVGLAFVVGVGVCLAVFALRAAPRRATRVQ